jgi:hypothetical protein
VAKPQGTNCVECPGQDQLHKGRRSGGEPLNKGVIQPAVSGHFAGVATYAVIGS